MISYEEFMNLENSDKFQLFNDICVKVAGKSLKANERKVFLRTIEMEDYEYWNSYKDGFDFKAEYDKMVKLDELATKRIEDEQKAREEESEKRKKIIELQKQLNAKVMYSKYDGFDKLNGDIISKGDIIYFNEEVSGWCLVK